MSRIFNKYIKLLILDASEEDFFYYLNEDDLYLTNSLNNSLEKLAERLNKDFHHNHKLPTFRSSNREAKAKYQNTIKYYENQIIKNKNEDPDDDNLIDAIISIFKYKVYLIDNKLSRKTIKNTETLREMTAQYIKKNFPELKNIDNKYFYNEKYTDLKIVKSLSGYIDIINSIQKQLNNNEKNNIYYRGHKNYNYQLLPSIYRENYINNEHKMYRDILIRNPEDFIHANSSFEKLTIMQHYGLPTRLLDVTKNSLVALFFACEEINNENNPAEVIIFNPSEKDIKYYDSDTVCILSNISKSERTLCYKNNEDFNESSEGQKILHLIKEDKPHFSNNINFLDFNRVLIVKPINNNNRVKRQSGYFFIFGFNEKITTPAELNCHLNIKTKKIRILVDPLNIKTIHKELNNLNINKESLFPEIENGTKHLKEIYNITY